MDDKLSVLEQDLAGKNAVVTGASRGIGRAIALHLAMRGASILGTCSSPNSLHHLDTLQQAVSKAYKTAGIEPPLVVGVPANVLSQGAPESITQTLVDRFGGKLDILVNNAAYCEFRPMGQLDAEHVGRVLSGNITYLVMLMEILYRRDMFRLDSRVINVSSDSTRTPLPYPAMILFTATKSAMESLTRSWADILGHHPSCSGTTVNSVAVGATATDALEQAPEALRDIAQRVIRNDKSELNVMGRAEDIADVVGLLASKRAGWMTGSVIPASGGATKIL